MSDPAADGRPFHLISAAELARMYARPDPGTRPLSDAEREQLRARLDAPGGSKIALEPREYDAWMDMPAIRTLEAIQALAAEVRAENDPNEFNRGAYGEGILAAIAWATGQTREGPITGRLPEGRVPTVSEMDDEEKAALRVLQARQERHHPVEFVTGVEACLMWLRAGCDDSPW
jgi:hypothetical protein